MLKYIACGELPQHVWKSNLLNNAGTGAYCKTDTASHG